MSIKRTLTAVAVDSFRDYLHERLQEIKQLDLDKDGQKDVDQVAALVNQLAERFKESVEATDFPKLASGLEQVFTGLSLIGESVDKQKLGATLTELSVTLKQLGALLQLGIADVKARNNPN